MLFPRTKAPDGKEHSDEYLLGFSKGLSSAAGLIQWADAYMSLLERQIQDLSAREQEMLRR